MSFQFLLQHGLYLPRREVIRRLLVDLGTRPDLSQEPHWNTIAGRMSFQLRQLVIAEFWRTTFNEPIDWPRGPHPLRQTIKAEAALWKIVWLLLEQMSSLGFKLVVFAQQSRAEIRQVRHPLIGDEINYLDLPPWTFHGLVIDGGLLMGMCRQIDSPVGATELRQAFQRENSRLLEDDNPFDPDMFPLCGKFVEAVVFIANRDADFRKKFYVPMIRARESVVTALRKQEKLRARQGNKPIRAGQPRKPKKT